ncbi:MAG TPA: aminotransferase class V-fold PLP-dependent enzyme [Caulobacteraceae bacterium]|jgi:selenocysteine lyase/cysteine desulfurase|nr:aminotransferase class V-fold PLP-dependent enzyme [Caulobacteraceae bacterium]
MSINRRALVTAGALAAAAAPMVAKAAVPGPDPLGVRADFPITQQDLVFLDSAFITPIPRQAADAGVAFFRAKAERPLIYEDVIALGDDVRSRFAGLVNATADEIGLLFSTGEGENVVADGLRLQAGDNVVIDELHYETEFVLYRQLEKTKGIQLRVVKHRDGAVTAADYEPFVDKKTRIVSVAWVSHQNGFRHDMRPLSDLAHAHGAWLHADAIQAVGALPVDVRAAGVDSLSANSYKWMMAGYGAAPFFVRRDLIERLELDRYGYKHSIGERPDGSFIIDPTARRFDYSSRAFGEAQALSASIAYLQKVGVDRIEAHGVGLALKLQNGLVAQGHRLFTPHGNRSQIVTLYGTRPVPEMKAAFAREKVQVTVRDGKIRIACAMFNTADDIDRCLAVTRKLI